MPRRAEYSHMREWEEFESFARGALSAQNPRQADVLPTLNSLEEVLA
jgi:hypothetical protein